MTAVPLPAVLGTCRCESRRRFKAGIHAHFSDCEVALEYKAGEKAGDQVRYGRSNDPRPDNASVAFLAGWDRSIHLVMGKSYRAISWDYPLHIDVQYGSDLDIRLDPAVWFRDRVEWYSTFVPDCDYGFEEPWEKPLAFLYMQIQEDREPHGTFQGGGAKEGILGRSSDLGGIRFRWAWEDNREWNEDDTRRLHRELGIEDANGDPIPLILDPQHKPAPAPKTVSDEILPLVGAGSAFTDRYIANVGFAMKYLREAADIAARAAEAGVDTDLLTDGLTGERAEVATFCVSMAKSWGPA